MKRNNKENKVNEICEKILRKITPSRKEKEKILSFSKNLAKNLNDKLLQSGIRADVSIQGSIEKDTWLAEEKDIDVFILLPKVNTREIFPKVLDSIKSFIGKKWIEAYAEHPYIEGEIEGYKIDFVPCFKISGADEISSSADRTPLHTSYIKARLNQQIKNEIRLLKQFTRGIGIYGAEIKVKGLSGYLCELLVIYYQSFLKTLQGIISWRFGQVIDIEELYNRRIEEVKLRFNAPLIVIDPVDANRNVAAAVSNDRVGELIMAAKLFLAKPNIFFFAPNETSLLSTNALKERLLGLGFDLVFIVFKSKKEVPDVVWGQLYKTTQALTKLLVQNDFQVLKSAVWSDGRKTNVLVFGLEAKTIPRSKAHMGPPLDSNEATTFIEKYTKGDITKMGPWAERGRWIVLIRRQHVEATSLLMESLRNQGKNLGIASGLVDYIKNAQILVNRDIIDFYSSNVEFAKFLIDFLMGRPKWIK